MTEVETRPYDALAQENIAGTDDDLFAFAYSVGVLTPPETKESDLFVIADALGISKEQDSVAPENRARKSHRLLGSLLLLGVLAPVASAIALKAGGFIPAEQGQSAHTEQPINIRSLPKHLPAAIKQYINSVGEVDVNIYSLNKQYRNGNTDAGGVTGSGIALNGNLALTAGHVLNSGTLANYGPNECQMVNFVIPGAMAYVGRYDASFSSNLPTTVPDVSLMATKNVTIQSLPRVKIAPKKPTFGEPLFFINYEPQANNVDRNPLDGFGPAIYGGIYEGQSSNGTFGNYEVITGLKSYGEIYDSSSRAGSSGGAVFNSEGELVGLSTRTDEGTINVSTYEQDWGVKLKGATTKLEISDTTVQPVTNNLLRLMMKKVNTPDYACNESDF